MSKTKVLLPKKSVLKNGQQIISTGEVVNYRDSWRIFRIMSEMVEGYQFLAELKREVTILGSARFSEDNKYYVVARELGKLLGENGFTTITGGGPGIMEAANRGAHEMGGESVGLNIQLPFEQRINLYVNRATAFYYFFTRKVMLTSPANAFVFFPGGFGTLDEFFEVVDYIELQQMEKSPIILVGKEFWQPIVDFLRLKSSRAVHSIIEGDLDNWHVVDTAEEAFGFIKEVADRPNLCTTSGNDPICKGGTDWRIFRIMAELVDGFEFLTKLNKTVTVLGTKSISPESPFYQAAEKMGRILSKHGKAVVTGGGPGIMEAANKGAYEAKGVSIGINMKFEKGERVNQYVNKSIGFFFPFVRKLIITSPSEAFVFFPGGFGTLHQLFELLTLIETKKIKPMPILLYGADFWQPLLSIIHDLHSRFGTISEIDESYLKLLTTPEDVTAYLK